MTKEGFVFNPNGGNAMFGLGLNYAAVGFWLISSQTVLNPNGGSAPFGLELSFVTVKFG